MVARHRILALDLATRLGWAYGSAREGDPVSGYWDLPKTGDDIGPFAKAFDEWLRSMITEAQPHVICFEAPMPTQAGRSTLTTTIKLQGLCWHCEYVASCVGVPARQVPAATWKKVFTGSGAAKKPDVIKAAFSRGLRVSDNNQADALGVWFFAAVKMAPAEVWRFEPIAQSA